MAVIVIQTWESPESPYKLCIQIDFNFNMLSIFLQNNPIVTITNPQESEEAIQKNTETVKENGKFQFFKLVLI